MRRVKYTYKYHALMTFLATFLSIIAVGAFAFLVAIRPEPRWNPQHVIPICGTLLGNSISGVSLTVNYLTEQIMEGGRREIELFLSFGASGWDSIVRLIEEAVRAGVTPRINSLNVIGLVSIPGEYSKYESNTNISLSDDFWLKKMTVYRNDDGTNPWRLTCCGGCALPDSHYVLDCQLSVRCDLH